MKFEIYGDEHTLFQVLRQFDYFEKHYDDHIMELLVAIARKRLPTNVYTTFASIVYDIMEEWQLERPNIGIRDHSAVSYNLSLGKPNDYIILWIENTEEKNSDVERSPDHPLVLKVELPNEGYSRYLVRFLYPLVTDRNLLSYEFLYNGEKLSAAIVMAGYCYKLANDYASFSMLIDDERERKNYQ